jgi:hypothetical protein
MFYRMKLHCFQNVPEIQQQSITDSYNQKSVPAVAEMLGPLHKVKHSKFAAQISNKKINLEVGSS